MSKAVPPPIRAEEAARPAPDRVFVLGAATSFLVLLLATEVVARFTTSRLWLYDRFDVSGALTSLPELEDRIRWARSAPRSLVLLGDSVLGTTALLEHGESDARGKTLPRVLQSVRGERVVSLGADGLVPLDLLAIARTVSRSAGGTEAPGLVLVVNFRMLAREHETEDRRLSRPFLAGGLEEGQRPGKAGGAFEESVLSARLFDAASRQLLLFRSAQLLRTLWYHPTQRDRVQRMVESALGRPPVGDVEEAALRMRILPFYQEPFREGAPALDALVATIRELRAVGDPIVVLSPQNPDVLEEAGDGVAQSRALLRSAVSRAGATRYLDLADHLAAPFFLDHCHLTPEGNRRFAEELSRALGTGGGA